MYAAFYRHLLMVILWPVRLHVEYGRMSRLVSLESGILADGLGGDLAAVEVGEVTDL